MDNDKKEITARVLCIRTTGFALIEEIRAAAQAGGPASSIYRSLAFREFCKDMAESDAFLLGAAEREFGSEAVRAESSLFPVGAGLPDRKAR